MRWRRNTPSATPSPAPPLSDQERYDANRLRFESFLDQARWLLEQQQRRSATFQQTAVALLGFDGVLLAVLVSAATLSGRSQQPAARWATVAAAIFIVASSAAGVLAILPRSTSAASASLTVKSWSEFHANGGYGRDAQHFAEMLLAADPPSTSTMTLREHLDAWWRHRRRREPIPTQPLLAAEELSGTRAAWASRSGWLLLGGVVCLAVALISGVTEPVPRDAEPSSRYAQQDAPERGTR